jgi:hypothetical protein
MRMMCFPLQLAPSLYQIEALVQPNSSVLFAR